MDFYALLADDAKRARARYNATHTPPIGTDAYTAHLLPDAEDRERYRAEAGIRFRHRLAAAILELCRCSLLDGHEHSQTVGGAIIGIQIFADQGHETYVAVRIIGSVSDGLAAVALGLVPGLRSR
jgi:hypothetical protein